MARGKTRPKILVTGVGGGVGQSILKCLEESPFDAIAMDSSPLAAGLHASAKAHLGVEAASRSFVRQVLAVCRGEGCRLVLPGLDVELGPLAANRARLVAAGTIAVTSRLSVIRTCDDKLRTTTFLRQHGFPAPRTELLSQVVRNGPRLPLVLKPRMGGSGSKGVHVVWTTEEFDNLLSRVHPREYLAQEYIQGNEYTAGSVTLGGACRGVIVMRRTLRGGDTHKAFVVKNERLDRFVASVIQALRPFGPCNVQFRLRGGTPYVIDINPRCSGTSYARALAGFNEPVAVASFLLLGELVPLSVRKIIVLRYWKELVVEPSRITELSRRKKAGAGRASL